MDDGSPDVERVSARSAVHLGGVAHIAEDDHYLIGIGDGEVRQRIDRDLSALGYRSVSLFHPEATSGSLNELGAGCVVTAGVRITTNVVLGRHVHVNINSTIGHDCRLADYVTINPGVNVSGEVAIGARSMLGTGSSVLQGVSIGEDCTIGAGAVVVRNVEPGTTVVGVPARPVG